METMFTNLTVPLQQWSDHVFQQLRNAKQGKDHFLTAFAAYIINALKSTQISHYDKYMFLLTEMHPEICATLPRGFKNPIFHALLKACLHIEADLCLEAKHEKN